MFSSRTLLNRDAKHLPSLQLVTIDFRIELQQLIQFKPAILRDLPACVTSTDANRLFAVWTRDTGWRHI